VELPPAAAGRLIELTELLTALLETGYVRKRWWTRLAPGQESPERHLERQLGLLHEGYLEERNQ
jgi:hypothetical protein